MSRPPLTSVLATALLTSLLVVLPVPARAKPVVPDVVAEVMPLASGSFFKVCWGEVDGASTYTVRVKRRGVKGPGKVLAVIPTLPARCIMRGVDQLPRQRASAPRKGYHFRIVTDTGAVGRTDGRAVYRGLIRARKARSAKEAARIARRRCGRTAIFAALQTGAATGASTFYLVPVSGPGAPATAAQVTAAVGLAAFAAGGTAYIGCALGVY